MRSRHARNLALPQWLTTQVEETFIAAENALDELADVMPPVVQKTAESVNVRELWRSWSLVGAGTLDRCSRAGTGESHLAYSIVTLVSDIEITFRVDCNALGDA